MGQIIGQSTQMETRFKQNLKSITMRTFKVVGKCFVNKGKDELRKAEQYVLGFVKKAIDKTGSKGNIAN